MFSHSPFYYGESISKMQENEHAGEKENGMQQRIGTGLDLSDSLKEKGGSE